MVDDTYDQVQMGYFGFESLGTGFAGSGGGLPSLRSWWIEISQEDVKVWIAIHQSIEARN
jgi:hypothetical protein